MIFQADFAHFPAEISFEPYGRKNSLFLEG
jgi:hypothetical protein